MRQLINWYNKNLEDAEFNRLGFGAFFLLIQTCIIIPATLLIMGGTSFLPVAIVITTIFSFTILVALIACLPIRITLLIFIVNIIVHLLMIALI